jgi:hypothetical protein
VLPDDISDFPKLVAIWVFITPLYVDGVGGPVNLLDRADLASFSNTNDHRRHPRRGGPGSAGLLWSPTALERTTSDDECTKAASKFRRRVCWGAAAVNNLRAMALGMPVDDIFAAIKETGRQLVVDGKMSLKPEIAGAVVIARYTEY